MSNQVEQIDPNQDLEQLTFDQYLASGVTEINQLTGRYRLVDKDALIDVPFIIIDYSTNMGEFGTDYVNVQLITKTDDHLSFNDGGVGIIPDLETWNHSSQGLYCPKGLRKSEYVNKDGIAGITYYFG